MRRNVVQALAVPAAVWAAATTAVLATATARGYSPFDPLTWLRGDSGLYLWIAKNGYYVSTCEPNWCGNAGWLPGYPWLVREVHHILGISYEGAAVGVSWFFNLATLVVIWTTFLGGRRSAAAIGALLFAAFAPGAIYGYAIFPISLLGFLTVAMLWLLYRRRWLAAGLAGAAATLTYPTALAVIPAVCAWALLAEPGSPFRRRIGHALLTGALTSSGALFVLYWLRHTTGHWNAYFLVQRKYHHHLQSPLANVQHALAHPTTAIALQTLLVTVTLASVAVVVAMRRSPLERLDLLLLVWALPAWLLVNLEAGISVYRAEATLLPVAVLARRLPPPLLYGLVVWAVIVLVWMTGLLLNRTLV
jgi:hypothetical protein